MFSSADALLRGTEHGSAVISRDLRGGGAKRLSDLRRDVHALASFLSSRGISRAAIVTDDTWLFETAFFACAAAGTVPVLPASVSEGYLSRCSRLFDAVLAEDGAVSGRDGTFSIAMLAAEYEPRGAMPPVSDTSPYMMFTSGSTGVPKLVTHTVSDLFLEARAAFRLLSEPLSRADFACATVPCRHAFGLAFRVMMPLLTLLPASVRCAVYEEEFSAMAGIPFIVTSPAFLKRLDGTRRTEAAAVMSAGGFLPEFAGELAQKAFGSQVTEIYGSTETGAFASRTGLGGSGAWKPLPGNFATVSDGTLCVQSPYARGGHLFRTDDLAEGAPDGRFTLRGRSGRAVKIEDNLISLDDVDACLRGHEWIRESRSVRLIRGGREEIGCAAILTDKGRDSLSSLGAGKFEIALRKSLRSVLDPLEIPRSWRFVERFPESSMGKIRDCDILELFAAGADQEAGRSSQEGQG